MALVLFDTLLSFPVLYYAYLLFFSDVMHYLLYVTRSRLSFCVRSYVTLLFSTHSHRLHDRFRVKKVQQSSRLIQIMTDTDIKMTSKLQ